MITTKDGFTEDTRLALLEQSIGHITQTLLRIENRMDGMESKSENRFDKMDNRFDRLDNRIWHLILLMISGFSGVLGVMAHGFHWIG